MIQDVFIEVSQLLRDYGGPVYSVEAKHLFDLHEFMLNGQAFESEIQMQEVYTALTTLALCDLARAAMYGDLAGFAEADETDLTRFFYRHRASLELHAYLDDEMPSGDINAEVIDRLTDDTWTRLMAATDTPKALSWMQARHHVDAALSDPLVAANPEAVAFFNHMGELLKAATGGMMLAHVLKPLRDQARSAIGKQSRDIRTENGSALVKAKALALYDAGGYAKGTNAKAAKGIYPTLQDYAQSLIPKQTVSPTRFAQTLGEWLIQRRKNTANQ